MNPVRIAIAGAGLIGREHARFIQATRSAELVAIADPSPDGAALAGTLSVPHFADYEAMLDGVKPDAAILALPNVLHVPAALACIRRGIPALVEKPIADTVESAVRLVEASEAAGVPILVGHQRRHSPDIMEARRCVQDGTLGRLAAINGVWFVRKHDTYFDVAWRREPGGGIFLINLIHDIDCFRYLCGEIEAVQCVGSSKIRGYPVEDTAAVITTFANGALGTMLLSDAVPSPWVWDMASGQAPYFPYTHADCYYVGGTKASLAVPTMEMWWHENDGDWRDPLTHRRVPAGRANCYSAQLEHFVDVVRGKASPRCDAREGMLTLATTLAVDRAAREQRSVTLKEMLPSQLDGSTAAGGQRP